MPEDCACAQRSARTIVAYWGNGIWVKGLHRDRITLHNPHCLVETVLSQASKPGHRKTRSRSGQLRAASAPILRVVEERDISRCGEGVVPVGASPYCIHVYFYTHGKAHPGQGPTIRLEARPQGREKERGQWTALHVVHTVSESGPRSTHAPDAYRMVRACASRRNASYEGRCAARISGCTRKTGKRTTPDSAPYTRSGPNEQKPAGKRRCPK